MESAHAFFREHPEMAGDSHAVADAEPTVRQWPDPPAAEAFYGLAGDFVKAIEPHSEADPVAILAQFHCMFGNVIGRGPYFTAEADSHYSNIFVALVGATSKGRKGSSHG